MKDRDLHLKKLFENMQQAQQLLHGYYHEMKTDMGISRSQMHILFAIKNAQPISFSELAYTLSLTRGAITQVVEDLVQKELVVRTNNTNDRRVTYLSLTNQGVGLFKKLEKRWRALMLESMASFNDREISLLASLYEKMIIYLQSHRDS